MNQPSVKQVEPIRFSIGLKLGILLAVVAICASGFTGYHTFNATRDILAEKATQNMIASTQVLGQRFSMMGQRVEDDARFLAQTALVQESLVFENPVRENPVRENLVLESQSLEDLAPISLDNEPPVLNSKAVLADAFKNLLSVRPEYFQLRLISAQQYGIELVRVDRDGEQIIFVDEGQLQEKQHYPYVYETRKLAKGETYFSKIFINREKGSHAGYDQPTLQVATPVTSNDGLTLAVIVINVDLNQMFNVLKADLASEYQLYLCNEFGDYLIHPDKSKTFGFDFGRKFLVQDDFSATAKIIAHEVETMAIEGVDTWLNNNVIGGFTRIPFGAAKDNRFVIFGLTAPLNYVLAETEILYRDGILIVVAFSLFAILLSALLAKIFTRPIKQLVNSVQQFSETQQLAPVIAHSRDELGLLARSISTMQKRILTQLTRLNRQNKALNQEIFEREQIEHFEKFRSHTLELLAKSEPLTSILEAIVTGVEQIRAEMLCSILLLDRSGKHFKLGIAPSLPEFYNEAILGVDIGPEVGSCGASAFKKERVIVEDIQTHPYWAEFKELAAQAGLASSWSQPIFSSSGTVLGTFAIYHHEKSTPHEADIKIIEQSARLASIAIEHKHTEDEINKLAFYDPLTHLPNRRLLLDRLRQVAASMAHRKTGAALLFVDLDKFKALNDSLGHDMGDQLLLQAAKRLTACVRDSDTVSRLSGDEFVVMLQNLSAEAIVCATQAEAIGKKILASLSQTYQLSSHGYSIYPSIGATLFEGVNQTAEVLLKQADLAMYQAKKAGGNMLYFFDPVMQATIMSRVALESELRNALARNEQFLLYYQKQVDTSGRAIGAEALIRWLSPTRGLIAPNSFIPIAEESGLILPLGNWIMATACKQLTSWSQDPATAHLTLAVNISARQIRMPTFVEVMLALIDQAGVNPSLLKLEITESVLLDNLEDIIDKMTKLKARGINFSIDDFGTGYSSLQYLKRLPLDQLKIDQTFVRDLEGDSNDRAIVRTIIAMAQSLSLDVIAEGVETAAQEQQLKDNGCSRFQGYLYGRPMPINEFDASLKQFRNNQGTAKLC